MSLRIIQSVVFPVLAILLASCEAPKTGGSQESGYKATLDEDTEPLPLERVGIAKQMAVSRGVSELPPRLVPLRGPSNAEGVRLWWLLEDYEYVYEPTCELITVSKDFVTDLASIPAVARLRHNPADYAEAALVHDWLYAIGMENERRKVDEIFLALMLETNVEKNKANEVYRAVRIGGNDGYGKKEDFSFFDPNDKFVRIGEHKPDQVFQKTLCD